MIHLLFLPKQALIEIVATHLDCEVMGADLIDAGENACGVLLRTSPQPPSASLVAEVERSGLLGED